MDHDTVAHLLLRERSKLYAYIWSFVHDPGMAEDVFQDVCLLAIRECQKLESESHIQSWCRRVARQRAIDCLRRRQRAPLVLDATVLDALDSHWDREDATLTTDLTAVLRRCVEKLTSRAREIVRLRYVEGMSVGKVAECMGAQADAMYKSLWRIHRQLGNCVEQQVSQDEKTVGNG
jgi:RNA polymerase sigma-70 factor, ECF subfamily